MSKWLGFSLTPHLQIQDHHHLHHHHDGDGDGDGYGDRHQHQELPLAFFSSSSSPSSSSSSADHTSMVHHPMMPPPLHSPADHPSFSPSSLPAPLSGVAGEAVTRGGVEAAEHEEESPKLEDFFSTTTTTGNLNINISPPPHESLIQIMYPSIAAYDVDGSCSSTSRPCSNSVAGLKAWLRQQEQEQQQQQFQQHNQCLSLTMRPMISTNGLMMVAPHHHDQQNNNLILDGNSNSEGKSSSKRGGGGKSIDTFGQRTSQFRGVTRHRWTGRYEAHLWDNSCRKEGQTRKGRQVYLGGYDKEEKAARAYDLAALKYWGPTTHINFPLSIYEKEVEEMKHMSRQEFVANLRRKSSGFSRGASMYRGVTRHHQHGRWQARIGRVAGNKDLYLGTFNSLLRVLASMGYPFASAFMGTQEEAAEAYDIAAIKFRGTSAVTNFDISRYDVKRICSSSTLIAGDLAKRASSPPPPATVLEDYNSRSSSEELQPIDMAWDHNGPSASSSSHLRHQQSTDHAAAGEVAINGARCLELVDPAQNRNHHQVPVFALWNQQ